MAKKKIMLIDDEQNILELVSELLSNEGYDVITTGSGREALEKLKTAKPDLILLDMMMPNMSGRQVCEAIRKNSKTKNLRIAFLTVAKFSEAGKEKLNELKVLDYITKPFDNQDLVERVKKILK
ncbi:MAG: response regulator [Nanoarchaeota archaeon]|nr:response regulator [Nanoarchaeota archaeon]MBU4351951.1 response regulator [Nanoarchaeota archaeon]